MTPSLPSDADGAPRFTAPTGVKSHLGNIQLTLLRAHHIRFYAFPASAEDALRALGSSWEWLADGSLRTVTATVPAIRIDDQPASVCRSGEKTFFNSVVAAYTGWNDNRNSGEKSVVFGGGVGAEAASSEEGCYLPPDGMEEAARVMQEVCVAFQWQRGDVLLLDNRTVMHSRQSFEGPRRILASLARDPLR